LNATYAAIEVELAKQEYAANLEFINLQGGCVIGLPPPHISANVSNMHKKTAPFASSRFFYSLLISGGE